jgi:hypothetical protein
MNLQTSHDLSVASIAKADELAQIKALEVA